MNKYRLIFLFLIFSFLISFLFYSFNFSGELAPTLSFSFAGDAIPHYMLRSILDKEGEAGILKLLFFVKFFVNCDANFFNLETTLNENPFEVKPFHFSVQPSFLSSLLKSGFTNYTIANNHSYDYGEKGFINTISLIDKTKATGFYDNNEIYYIKFKINDLIISFLSFTTISNYPINEKNLYKPVIIENPLSDKSLKNTLNKLDEDSDILIVGVHWGNEYELLPNLNQKVIAQYLIDNGVDIVWGNHTHVIEPFEIYKDKLILYSCGNLMSGQAYNLSSSETKSTNNNYFFSRAVPIIKVYFIGKKISKIELVPFFQVNNHFLRKQNENYSSLLIPTKYFIGKNKDNDLTQLIFSNENIDTNLYIIKEIKEKYNDKTTIKNIIEANKILFETFFSNYLNIKNSKDNYKIKETENSFIIEFDF